MKSEISILDYFFNDGSKALAGIFMIFLFFGSLYIFNRPLFLKDLVIGSLSIVGLFGLGSLMYSKKVLFMENGRTFQGLVIRNFIFFKKQIELDNVIGISIYENKNPLIIPWWISMIGNLLSDTNPYKLKLVWINEKEKYLISFSKEKYKDMAIKFFERNTDLKVKYANKEI